MKKNNILLLLAVVILPLWSLSQIYVSPTGSAANPGTLASPTTFEKAITTVQPGQTIYMRGGTYNYGATIVIESTNNGTAGALKNVEGYNGEIPILDFSAQALTTSNRGLVVDGDYWYFKGLIIQNAGDNGVLLSGNNNTFNNCIFRKNRDSGLQMSRYNTANTSISQWPSNNLILNCEAFDNKDATSENADGFAAKLTCGNGNIFRGCIAHNNSDDGWDFYAKSETGPIGIVTLDNCVAYNNGTLTDGTTSSNGDKNGFKLGGSGIAVNHIVRRCVAFGNGQHGFTDNNNPGNMEVSNNTSWNNKQSNFNFRDGSKSTHRNNLSLSAGASDKTFGTEVGTSNVWWKNNVSTNSGSLVVSSADFVTLSFPATYKNADGSPNLGNFLALATGSDMINAGVTAPSITFNGSAPDLGARESGTTGGGTTTYTLTTTASPAAGGTITRSPNATSYAAGTVVTLTAVPASGYTFSNWSGAASGTSTTTTVTINANTTATAVFTTTPPSTYTLTTTASPAAGGTITRSPNATSYAAGTVVTLTAVPASGYTFSNWSGAASGTSTTTTVTINANTTATAVFTTTPPNTYTLTTTASPAAGGTITRSPNAASYAAGTVVTLTATPASGYNFSGWSGDASGTNATTTVTMSANRSAVANFTATGGGGTSTLRVEDATTFTSGFCAFNGSRQNSYTGAANGFYINLSNSAAQGITYSINAPAAGTYGIAFRYANAGSSSATTARILVNGTSVVGNLAFPKTSAWTTWVNTTSVNITLRAGANTIRLETTVAAEFANIDWFEITGNNPTAAACSAAPVSALVYNEGGVAGVENTSVSVYPNPAKGKINVQIATPKAGLAMMSLFDQNNRCLLKNTRSVSGGINAISLNCSNLQPAIYLLKTSLNGVIKTLKIMVL